MTFLEHPRNSIAWRLPELSHTLRAISADVVVIAARAHGANFRKHWALATCFRPLQELASARQRPSDFHEPYAGVQDDSGNFKSHVRRQNIRPPGTAVCIHRAHSVSRKPGTSHLCRSAAAARSPRYHTNRFRPASPAPTMTGGIASLPDWSTPPPGVQDKLQPMRIAPS